MNKESKWRFVEDTAFMNSSSEQCFRVPKKGHKKDGWVNFFWLFEYQPHENLRWERRNESVVYSERSAVKGSHSKETVACKSNRLKSSPERKKG